MEDAFVEDCLLRIANSLEAIEATNRAHWRSYIEAFEYAVEREQAIEERAQALHEATLRRAEETHEQHELVMAASGARAPDFPPEEPPLNRAARRRQGRRK